MCIIKYEPLHHLHDEHLHVPVEVVNLVHEDDFAEFLKCFHWIRVEKLAYVYEFMIGNNAEPEHLSYGGWFGSNVS